MLPAWVKITGKFVWMVVAVLGSYEFSSHCDTLVIDCRFCIVVRWPKNLMMLEECLLQTV
jgi:hypothetical protein